VQNLTDPKSDSGEALVVLIPVFEDWPAVSKLLPLLDASLAAAALTADVVLVDDGSTSPLPSDFCKGPLQAVQVVHVLALRRNLGHQRAIAMGLAFVEAKTTCEIVVVMDGDGEDDPADVPRLVAECRRREERIVFAERTRRSESWTFRASYALYRALHLVLTGHRVKVGNFSAIPRVRLRGLVVVPELWTHYAAAALASRQPRCLIPTRRAARLHGTGSMSYLRLVAHGLRAISVYKELVGVRMLVAAALALVVGVVAIGVVAVSRRGAPDPWPTWAAIGVGFGLVSLVQAVLVGLVLTFVLLSDRAEPGVLPARDYSYFVSSFRALLGRPPAG
jgi:hypothetical protein